VKFPLISANAHPSEDLYPEYIDTLWADEFYVMHPGIILLISPRRMKFPNTKHFNIWILFATSEGQVITAKFGNSWPFFLFLLSL